MKANISNDIDLDYEDICEAVRKHCSAPKSAHVYLVVNTTPCGTQEITGKAMWKNTKA